MLFSSVSLVPSACWFRCPSSVFYYASNFNQAVNEWDVARVTDMNASECLVCWAPHMFAAAGSRVFFYIADNPLFFPLSLCVCCFRCPSSVFLMTQITFNQALNEWDVAKVTDMKLQ